MHMKKLKN